MAIRPFFCGNWKLWGNLAESAALAAGVRDGTVSTKAADVAVAPGFLALTHVVQTIKGSALGVASQDCHWETKGAFTGEVAAAQIADAGARYAIVGHSERRQLFGETDEHVGRKAIAAAAAGLCPIVCVGETLAERDGEQTLSRIGYQLDRALKEFPAAGPGSLIVAYEPVWAICTGRNATPAQAQEVHQFIRGRMDALFGTRAAGVRILYGGSGKPDNVTGLLAQADIDGALVGGASLTVESFVSIVKEGTAACTRS
jgi:triosephosphate isomerase